MNTNSILGGVWMDDHPDYIDSSYHHPLAASSSMLMADDIETLILHNRGFPILDDDHHQYDDEEDNIDIIPTDDVLLYFKDPIPHVFSEVTVSKSVTEESTRQASTTMEEDVSMSIMISAASDVTSAMDVASSLVLPLEGTEMNAELTVFHLLLAYAEAMEMGQEELGEVISKRISEKVSPIGESTVECLMYYMFLTSDHRQSDYLKQESVKNFHQAFKAFYQIFPHGKFAHFGANLAILESLPKDHSFYDAICIFDFDIGEGIQWASLIEAIGRHNHGGRLEVRIVSVKFAADRDHEGEEGEEEEEDEEQMWKFEDTRKRLCDYARSYGLKLKVDEMECDDGGRNLELCEVVGRRQFYVFNCMVGLPHMGRVRRRKDVFNFLRISQTFLRGNRKGIVTFGDGDGWEKARNASCYASFLDENMAHYQALLESIKLNFPSHLGEARTAMECLFVAPFVSCKAWAEKWAERNKYGGDSHENSSRFGGLKGLRLSQESLLEAKEVVREGESLYGVRIEGESHNEMIMEWRGIPMVKVSCWTS